MCLQRASIEALQIEAGADVNLVDCEDETPLTYAAKYGVKRQRRKADTPHIYLPDSTKSVLNF